MKIKTATLLLLITGPFLVSIGTEKADASPGLYEVKVNGKYGFIDRSGKMVIQPAFDNVLEFKEGLAAVYVGEKCGFIDAQGQQAIKAKFDDCDSFADGMAAVKVRKKWGYLDKTGKMVIAPEFDYTLTFSEGLAFVEKGDKSGFIDKTGKVLFAVDGHASWFSEGLASVSTPQGDKAYFIDQTGKQAFSSNFGSAGDFSEGLASVSNGNEHGYIDKTGKVVIPFKSWGPRGGFSEGLAVVFLHEGGIAYIDKTGNAVISGDFVRAEPFSEGLAPVMIKAGKDSVTSAETKNSSVMMIKSNGKYGYIDKTGAIVIPPKFAQAREFAGGLAKVCMDSPDPFDLAGAKAPCGYIDKTGKMIWEPSR